MLPLHMASPPEAIVAANEDLPTPRFPVAPVSISVADDPHSLIVWLKVVIGHDRGEVSVMMLDLYELGVIILNELLRDSSG